MAGSYTKHGHKLRFASRVACFAGLTHRVRAACSVRGSPSGWGTESDLSDFYVLRRGFIPRRVIGQKRNLCPRSVYQILAERSEDILSKAEGSSERSRSVSDMET